MAETECDPTTWIAAGDLNNDGRDDVIGSWKGDGVYFRNSATGKWTKLSTPARQLATGNVHGDGRDDPMESSEETVFVVLSQEGPGGAAFDMSVLDEDGPTPIDGGLQ